MSLADTLPDFPWDTIASAKATAAAHRDGLIDLSIGTPVDPTPEVARRALAAAADSPGYPFAAGTAELRTAQADYLARRWGVVGLAPEATLPLIGTKELVGWLPTMLGLGSDDLVVVPETAYPTYLVGALLARCASVALDDLEALGDRPEAEGRRPALVWLNSPSNPTGQILAPEVLRDRVRAARALGAVVISDECYGEFGWEAEPVSVLHPEVCEGDHTDLLVLHSLSKRSNLAGYRAGLVAGDQRLISELLQVRKHAGMLVPGPVQRVMIEVLGDQDHVAVQRERYLGRRALLRPALESAGFRIDHSEGSLYLWATRGEDSRASLDFLAERGILAAPGDFYGVSGTRHVRFALTAPDERIAAAAARLTAG